MAGQRQPIALVQAKGKKHLTKAEIAERERTEVKAPSDRVTPPSYLTATQKKAFRKTVKELRAIDLISNLDVEALARLVIAQEKYREVTETIAKQPLMVTVAYDTGKKDAEGNPIMAEHEVVNSQVERLAIIQDRYFKQCRQGAADFGLTVSSRCRLIIPKHRKHRRQTNLKTSLRDDAMQDRTTQYAADVLAGKIIAGDLVKLACKRHLDDIEKSKAAPYKYYFDVEQAERIIEFAETLTIAEGEEEEQVECYAFQCFILGNLNGWRTKTGGHRRFRTSYVQLGRQNGKSFLNGILAAYYGNFEKYKYGQIYCTATKKDQSLIVFNEIVKFIRSDPDLDECLFCGSL